MKKTKLSAQNVATSLRLDWCSYEAAKYAVMNWHYSRRMPASKVNTIGAWENGQFIGTVVFGLGANANIAGPFRLSRLTICELARVALRRHGSQVSRIVTIAVRMIRARYPKLGAIVSYADPAQGHAGGIYQAMGWSYLGISQKSTAFLTPTGELVHKRTVSASGHTNMFGKRSLCYRYDQCTKVAIPGKHKYMLPLDPEVRARIESMSKPYPKIASEVNQRHATIPGGEGGAAPTRALEVAT